MGLLGRGLHATIKRCSISSFRIHRNKEAIIDPSLNVSVGQLPHVAYSRSNSLTGGRGSGL